MTNPRMNRHRIDQTTFDLLVMLSSKLEALEAYERLDSGHGHGRELQERLQEEDRRHADLLADALLDRLGTGPRSPRVSGERVAQP